MKLVEKKCIPCQGGVPPLNATQIAPLAQELGQGWQVIENHHLFKEYSLKSFKETLKATNLVGELAEEQGHHPNLYLSFKKLEITLFTNKIDGLTESDFVLAAKIEAVLKQLS